MSGRPRRVGGIGQSDASAAVHRGAWRRGGEVEKFYLEGRIREIAEYCESDVVNTYRVWLRHELFRGRLSVGDFNASEANLVDFIKTRGNTKPHLAELM
jgi:3'-5' exonuclease